MADKIQKIIQNLWEHFPIQLLFKLVNDFPVSSEVVFRGFQKKAHSLSNPVVNKRLREEMMKNEKMAEELITMLEITAANTCTALSEIESVTDEAIIELSTKFNKEDIAVALTLDERVEVNAIFARLDEIIPDIVEENEDKPVKQDSEASIARWQHKCEMLEKKLLKYEDQMSKIKKEKIEQINRIKELEKEIENLTTQINKYKIESNESTKECSSFQKQIDRLERNLKKEIDAKNNLEKENTELKAQIFVLENKPVEKEIITEEKVITEQIIPTDKKNKVKEAIALLSSIFTENVTTKKNTSGTEDKPAPKPKAIPILKSAPATSSATVPPKVTDKIKIMSEGKLLDLSPSQIMTYLKQNNKKIIDSVRTHYNKLVAPHDKELLNTLIKAKIPNQIICGPLKPAIIDGSNVAHFLSNGERPKLEHLIQLRHTCWLEGYFPVYIIVDASLPYQIDNEAKLSEMIKLNEVIPVCINTVADKEILKRAIELNAVVLTNDRYTEWPDGDKVSKRHVIQSRNIMKPGDYHHKNGINWGKLS
jgi:myosin heavy subunit